MAARGDQGRRPILRGDYRPPAWLVDHVDLELELAAESTRVLAHLDVRRNPEALDREPLRLSGVELKTRRVLVDGQPLADRQRTMDGESMVIGGVPDVARITTEVEIHPERNTALEGLYAAGSSLLTQCEAEGFRKITWFPDRPDVMATFRVRLIADRARYPLLLSNGNQLESGELEDGRHYAVWEDPFPKPSYLFAVVAADLAVLEDHFTTRSGRQVALKVYSEPVNLHRLDHAMASLKRAMAWDEERWGLEYDLDVYHIIATHDFNMGAMENKSLNIFNARYVLADPDTATDADYEAVEAVIGHEYFHNWTGNRVTCRDWFQLTLKEGLTVFRDQEFTADLRSRAVKRIADVATLMARQFPEDAGPMAHSVRPERYIEINNFYTATVYEKGAEVVRMYQTLLGREGFRRGLDLYFERHDGQAVTCDDFLAAMADANDRDLTQFARWYAQVGTPRLEMTTDYDHERGHYILRFRQSLSAHPDNEQRGPLMVPVKIGFLGPDNQPLPVTRVGEDGEGAETRLLVLTNVDAEFRFDQLPPDALPSVLRDFSAPVRLDYDWSDEQLARLAGHDPDPFSRWQAMRRLAERVLTAAIEAGARLPDAVELLIAAWKAVLEDETLDPALAAELLSLPSEAELAQQRDPVDVDCIHESRKALLMRLSQVLEPVLRARYLACRDGAAWSDSPEAVGRRALSNLILNLMLDGQCEAADGLAVDHYESADNMTDRMGALKALVHGRVGAADRALRGFEDRYRDDPLVMDKWFAVQASVAGADAVRRIEALMAHPAFSLKNPNKVRALLGTFGLHNPTGFHAADGSGYALMGRVIRELDGINPQVAARLATVFNRWQAYGAERAGRMRGELEAIADKKGLSPDVEEIVKAALRAGTRKD
ncbi:aminopeptidase N [Wenzhouxiangella marina]|uniref:Aminopeptidase N n=1 Tax=Wenzhouxiangella marina TaxID=1579979 RepID=A0A0K0XYT7_9GAMM|nr:aminopeptidase N [Wenzhouxiangella marina]AKS42835.1 Aminopeptidase N [Wenzhouxiangella marina]MBB6087485.1 aminopeptidase N [Wenzhouxiangella marina]